MKGHAAMLAANSMWGLMAPLAKFVMIGGAVSSLVMTDLRVFGAMVLFWIFSFFQKPEHVGHKDLMKLFVASLLAIVFNQGSYIFGVGLTSPVDASIITTSMPLIAMILAGVSPWAHRGRCCLSWEVRKRRPVRHRRVIILCWVMCLYSWHSAVMLFILCCLKIS